MTREAPKAERVCSSCGDRKMIGADVLRRMIPPVLCRGCSIKQRSQFTVRSQNVIRPKW